MQMRGDGQPNRSLDNQTLTALFHLRRLVEQIEAGFKVVEAFDYTVVTIGGEGGVVVDTGHRYLAARFTDVTARELALKVERQKPLDRSSPGDLI